jgi:hypothetical protein
MQGNDFYSGQALSGAGSGAASGALVGSQIYPGYGTAIGALAGGALGLFGGALANSKRDDATKAQVNNIDQLISQFRSMSESNYSNYLAGLNKAIGFYGPATQRWNYLYGTGTGQGGMFPETPTVSK